MVGGSTQPRYPDYSPGNSLGTISARQSSSGGAIAWGVYPNTPADAYSVYIYINGVLRDKKINQYYPPHGSVPASLVPRRAIFELKGTARSGSNVASFWLTCKAV